MNGARRFRVSCERLGYQAVSSLWTPGGEIPVSRRPTASSAAEPARPVAAPNEELLSEDAPLTEEEQAELEEFMAMQQQLAETPAASIIANHCLGFFQLAALHLQSEQPNLVEARLAIDAFGGVLEACKGRLGPDEATLADGLTQIRLAYVQIQKAAAG